MAAENHRTPEIGAKNMAAIERLEVFAAQVAVHGLQLFAVVARLAGNIEGLFIHIRRINLDSAAKCLNPQGLGKHHRGGISLLAGGTAGAPNPDRISRRFLLKQPGDDLLAQVTPRHGIAKERCDIDQDRIEQLGKLLGMDFEIVQVIDKTVDIYYLHAFSYSAHQTGALVTAEIKPAVLLQIIKQILKLLVFAFAHGTSPVETRVSNADGISSSGNMKSTQPVCEAAPGMPKNSELFSSWTITVPPIFLIALTPMEPALPVPERTTAMARSL